MNKKNKKRIIFGGVCASVGAVIGGYLVYRGMKSDLNSRNELIKQLTDNLSRPEEYAEEKAKEIATNILEWAFTDIYVMDESPENLASKITINIIEEYKDKYLDENSVNNEVKRLAGLALVDLFTNKEIGILEDIPDGTYGNVTITHF